jgi:hypothetical protein
MKRGRLTSAIVAAISVPALGLGLGLTLGGAASARTISARQYSERTVVINCQGQPQVRPGSFTLACADGNDYLSSLSWTSWTPGLASATGVQHENDCVPYCAAGHFRRYPVDVVFWGSAAAPGGLGSQRYTKVTLLYPGARPAYYGHQGPATLTLTLAP